MLQSKIVLVDTTATIDATVMAAAAEALNVQIARDVAPFWNVGATVSYGPDPNSIPQGMWPVLIVDTLPDNEGGYHQTRQNQPYALVLNTPGSDEWTIDASHEIIEMLVDPYGNRLQNSTSIELKGRKIEDGTGQFGYLVEACDPCEADKYAYPISGIAVSDFITPHFYDPVATPGTRYSFTGAIKAPRQILPGGYISWVNHETDQMQQLLYVDPNSPPKIVTLGAASAGSLRVYVDNVMHKSHDKTSVRVAGQRSNLALLKRCKEKRQNLESISMARAKLY